MSELFNIYCQMLGAVDCVDQPKVREDLKAYAVSLCAVGDTQTVPQELSQSIHLDAAVALYAAGYYARAARLVSPNDFDPKIGHLQRWLAMLLGKVLQRLESEVTGVSADMHYEDAAVASRITSGQYATDLPPDLFIEDKVVGDILVRVCAEALTHFLAFAQCGNTQDMACARSLLIKSERLAAKAGDHQWLWRLKCLELFLGEFEENSLWKLLGPMMDDPVHTKIVTAYIAANYRRGNPVVELWASQSSALESINDSDRKSFVLKMPTSAGKTRVAELMILRYLLDFGIGPSTKTIYIAPFRKLASEVEQTLNSAFKDIADRVGFVSSFYGGKEVDLLDKASLHTASILVVTPEKLDALLRQNSDLISQIRLVIADEGHMIGDDTKRGWQYRAVLERLVYVLKIRRAKDERDSARVVLVSGVLPNKDEFAEWIAGNRNQVVSTDWRPFDPPEFRDLIWNGEAFFDAETQQLIPLAPWFRRDAFTDEWPHSFEHSLGRVAQTFAWQSKTMLFSANKSRMRDKGLLEPLVDDLRRFPIWKSHAVPDDLLNTTDETLQLTAELLEYGVAVHHGDLPAALRREMEQRIEQGTINLVVASPTLAQGVNLPISTLLIYELEHAQYRNPVSQTLFWNVVGRVGRAIPGGVGTALNTTPIIWFVLDKTDDRRYNYLRRLKQGLLETRDKYRISSHFLYFLIELKALWDEQNGDTRTEDLVLTLATNQLSWIVDKTKRHTIENLLALLDRHLDDLSQESRLVKAAPEDCLQQVTEELMLVMTGASEISQEHYSYIRSVLQARARFIERTPEQTRRRLYLLDLPLKDCEAIFQAQEELLGSYMGCRAIFSGDFETGIEPLSYLVEFALGLSVIPKDWRAMPSKRDNDASSEASLFDLSRIPDKGQYLRSQIIKSWLRGDEEHVVAHAFQQAYRGKDFAEYQEDILEQNLPWVVSAISRYLGAFAKERGHKLPRELELISALVKYGVPNATACIAVKSGFSRSGAVNLSRVISRRWSLEVLDEMGIETPIGDTAIVTQRDLVKALLGLNAEEINNLNLSAADVERVKVLSHLMT